jgi:AraC family transcriptional regulator, 4-hydroxyphenylacetate 3-monooxygenase operon regulatory protein
MTKPPVFREQGRTYHADRCEPLVAAVKRGEVRLDALVRKDYPGMPLRRSDVPGVLSVGCWDAVGNQKWGLDWHRNEGIELTLLETGSMPFAVGGKAHLLKPGSLTITRPWQPHRVGDPHIGPGRLHWLILDVGIRQPHQTWKWPRWFILTREDVRDLTRLLSHNERPVWPATPDVVACFQRITRAVTANRRGSAISMLSAYINELFALVLDLLRKQKAPLDPGLTTSRRTVEMFLKELHDSPEQQAEVWPLERMAQRCGMGTTHFGNLCKRITNMTPVEYLNYCRVETASALLVGAPDRSITDVAFACGFQSSQYFATVFRRLKGVSPREIRERAQ